MERKQKTTQPRVVVAVRIARTAADRFRAAADSRGKKLSDVLREVIERAAKRAA
jgi:uncharacterized protein (DUF4415 family)